MDAIAVRGVTIRRRASPVLEDVDLIVGAGERLGLLGPSGSGKTALLRVMAGLDTPESGSVQVGGRPVERGAKQVTMVFQGDAVYDHLDVEGNLAFPLLGRGEHPDARVREAAGRFFLGGLLDRSPETLSAGQRRAVAAARALARGGISVVLLDDPLVGADQRLRRRLVDGVMSDPELTVVFATREPNDALRWADRVAVLWGGRLAQVGSPVEVYRRPVSLPVAEAMGECNRIPGVFRRGVLEVAGSRLQVGPTTVELGDARRVVVGVRPGDLAVAGPGTPFWERLRGTVGRVEPLGATQRVLFGLGEHRGVGFSAEIESGRRVSPGDTVDWWPRPDALRLYDPGTGEAL